MRSNKIHSVEVNKIIHSIGLKYNLRDSEVRAIVESQFRFAYEKIQSSTFDEMNDEELEQVKTNFLFKYLGKLYTSPTKIKGVQKRRKDYEDRQK